MFSMTGIWKSNVKTAETDFSWQPKQDNWESKNRRPVEKTSEQRQIEAFREDLKKVRENGNYAMVYDKVKNGKELSPKEAEYLQKNYPKGYEDYKYIQAGKGAFKGELEECENKEDVRKLKAMKMGNCLVQAKVISNNPNLSKTKKVELLGRIISRVMSMEETFKEYEQSGAYTAMENATALNGGGIVETFLGEEFDKIKTICEVLRQENATSNVKCSA